MRRLIDADAFIREIRKRYCEDCARRKGIKNGKMRFCYEIGGVPCRACDIEDVLDALDDYAPTVQPEPKRGKWISLDDFRGKYNENGYKCSMCGEHSNYEENFCPNCGADMKGVTT